MRAAVLGCSRTRSVSVTTARKGAKVGEGETRGVSVGKGVRVLRRVGVGETDGVGVGVTWHAANNITAIVKNKRTLQETFGGWDTNYFRGNRRRGRCAGKSKLRNVMLRCRVDWTRHRVLARIEKSRVREILSHSVKLYVTARLPFWHRPTSRDALAIPQSNARRSRGCEWHRLPNLCRPGRCDRKAIVHRSTKLACHACRYLW